MKNSIIQFLFLLAAVFIFNACKKEAEYKTVTYQITNSHSGFYVNYLNGNAVITKDTVVTASAADIWTYSFKALPRDIAFVSAIYKDSASAILVRILVDGKVFRQGASKNDTTMYVTVSGTIPE